MLLATGPLLADDQRSLLSVQPFDRLVWFKPHDVEGLAAFIWLTLATVIGQACWLCRALLLPPLALMGTVMAIANEASAVSVVVIAVAVGLVFEVDRLLYVSVVSPSERDRYAKSAWSRTPLLSVPGSPNVSRNYGWLLWCANVALCVLQYRLKAFPSKDGDYAPGSYNSPLWTNDHFRIVLTILVRAGMFAIASLHLALRARADEGGSAPAVGRISSRTAPTSAAPPRTSAFSCNVLLVWDLLRMLLSAGITTGCAFAAYLGVYYLLATKLGYSVGSSDVTTLIPRSPLAACLGNPTKTEACLLSDEAALFAGVTSPVPSGARPPWWDDLAWWDFRCRVTACSSGL